MHFSSQSLIAGLLSIFKQILFGLGEVMLEIAKSSGYDQQWVMLVCRIFGFLLTCLIFRIAGNKIVAFLIANKKGVLIILVALWLLNSGRGGNALDALIH